jgi:hypothetical protein
MHHANRRLCRIQSAERNFAAGTQRCAMAARRLAKRGSHFENQHCNCYSKCMQTAQAPDAFALEGNRDMNCMFLKLKVK